MILSWTRDEPGGPGGQSGSSGRKGCNKPGGKTVSGRHTDHPIFTNLNETYPVNDVIVSS